VFVAPAMDLDMFRHPANQKNMEALRSFGNIIIEPGSGELASGLLGKGRMEEPENILSQIKSFFSAKAALRGVRFLVTAGPTYEKLDPVRFIGNYSSGKMGFAIAEELASLGADVILVSGPTHLDKWAENIELIRINTAEEMYKACMSFFPSCNGAVMSAAVADFMPTVTSEKKVKSKSNLNIELKPTQDIAAELGKIKQKTQFLVGFALETNDEKINAVKKLKQKNLDFIVLNSLNDAGAGFNTDTNKVTFIQKDGSEEYFDLKPKRVVARDIVQKLLQLMDIKIT
jgi:phosphopantothenoylcysteine decarboxylase/phosphopantothenate--cysteine ligase